MDGAGWDPFARSIDANSRTKRGLSLLKMCSSHALVRVHSLKANWSLSHDGRGRLGPVRPIYRCKLADEKGTESFEDVFLPCVGQSPLPQSELVLKPRWTGQVWTRSPDRSMQTRGRKGD